MSFCLTHDYVARKRMQPVNVEISQYLVIIYLE